MSEVDTFLTIKGNSDSLLKEKGSKFIGFATHVNDESEIKTTLDVIRKELHDATHHCYAYRIGFGDNIRALSSDDGEPSGSAGAPMLAVLEGASLTNILAVVTRYYGGTKLGVGGLARAYGGCVKELITDAEIVENIVRSKLEVLVDYNLLSAVLKTASAFKAEISQGYKGDKAFVQLSVRISELENLRSELIDATSGAAIIN